MIDDLDDGFDVLMLMKLAGWEIKHYINERSYFC